MTVEVSLKGVRCNLACTYCYQNVLREAGVVAPKLDLPAVFAALEEETAARPQDGFTVFGGEPLLSPMADLEALWEYGLRKAGSNSIQTNGALITDVHLAAFKRYRVHVGFSIDGPGELNRQRWAGSIERTDAATASSIAALERCLAGAIGASLIVTIYKDNASSERLPRLVEWLSGLAAKGLQHARIHLLELDGERAPTFMLSREENVAALKALHRVQIETGLQFDLFKDMVALLRGKDASVTCVWNACDVMTTPAVRAVEADGSRSNCTRANKDGVNWVKHTKTTYHRQLALYATPREHGGCQGCRFFLMCKGQCPGTAIAGDWRNRSSECETWMDTFEYLEAAMLIVGDQPVSLRKDRPKIEEAMLAAFAADQFCSVEDAVAVAEGRRPRAVRGGDGHANTPHGNVHGDHNDSALLEAAR